MLLPVATAPAPRRLAPRKRVLPALLGLALLGCPTPKGSETGVSRDECVDIVRKQTRLRSEDTGGLQIAVQVSERSAVDQCVAKVTQSAKRCVMQANSAADLRGCDVLFR